MAARATFDQIEINPTTAMIVSSLEAAATEAHGRARLRTLIWPFADLDEFLTLLQSDPEGIRGWRGGVQSNHFEARCQVIAIWWTDPIGRKHVRILGGNGPDLHRTIGLRGGHQRRRTAHWPLEQLYPERAARIWQEKQAPTLVMLCACGALGTPDTLHWMGTCCGPCHDRGIDGNRVAAPIADNTVYSTLAFSADSRTLAFGNGRSISLMELETNEVMGVPLPDAAEWKLRGFLADGRLVISNRTRTTQDIAIWEPGTSVLLHHNFPQVGRDDVVLAPEGNLLAAFGQNGLRVFSLPECHLLWAFEASRVNLVAFSHDNVWFTMIGRDSNFVDRQRVYEARTGRLVHELPEEPRLDHIAVSSAGRYVVGITSHFPANRIVMADLRDDPPTHTAVTPKWSLHSPQFDPSGRYLFAVSGKPLLWVLPDLKRPIELEWSQGSVLDAVWSPDGRWLATCDLGGQLRLWPWRELLGLIEQTRTSESPA